MFRNNYFGRWGNDPGGMNMVFVGVDNAPDSYCVGPDGRHYTVAPKTPRIAEKPYIARDMNDATKF
jgi:hypothetical protein